MSAVFSLLGEIGDEMRSSDDSVAPIIIKRKKTINNSTPHGGAWKVAYADFVTAMMAFFMLNSRFSPIITSKQSKPI